MDFSTASVDMTEAHDGYTRLSLWRIVMADDGKLNRSKLCVEGFYLGGGERLEKED